MGEPERVCSGEKYMGVPTTLSPVSMLSVWSDFASLTQILKIKCRGTFTV
jgi:hypothetical protein